MRFLAHNDIHKHFDAGEAFPYSGLYPIKFRHILGIITDGTKAVDLGKL